MDALPLKYTVERYEYGWVIRGAFPVSDMEVLMKLIPEDGVVDALVASYYGGTMALATREGSRKWRKALDLKWNVEGAKPGVTITMGW